MKNKYLSMGTGESNDFFAPYDQLASNINFMDGFEFAIRAIYPDKKEKEPFIKGGKVHQILEAGMLQYSKTHTEEETNMFRIGGGVACLVSTAHETWAATERKTISAYVTDAFASYICQQNKFGIPLATEPEELAKEFRNTMKKDVNATLS